MKLKMLFSVVVITFLFSIFTAVQLSLATDSEPKKLVWGLTASLSGAGAYWGQGIMSRALPLLFDYAFHSLRLHRLEADIDPRNQRSLKTLKKLGFQKEGYLRQRHWVNDERQDSVLLGLLANEWK